MTVDFATVGDVAAVLLLALAAAGLAVVLYNPLWVPLALAALPRRVPEPWWAFVLRYHLSCPYCQCLVSAVLLLALPVPPIVLAALAGAAGATWLHRVVATCPTCGPKHQPGARMPGLMGQQSREGAFGQRQIVMPDDYKGPPVADLR